MRAAAGSRLSGPACNPEGGFEFGGRLGMGDPSRLGLGDDDEVERRRHVQAPLSKYLTNQPFHAVPDHGVADPGADRDPEARERPRRRSLEDDEARRVTATAAALEGQVFPTPPEPDGLRVRV